MSWPPVKTPVTLTPKWTRLLLHGGTGLVGLTATANRDPSALVTGGINVPGGAANGVTENATESRISVETVGADKSRANVAAVWTFPFKDWADAEITTVRSFIIHFRVKPITYTANKQIILLCGTTNDVAMATQHSESGILITGAAPADQGCRAGSSGGVVTSASVAASIYGFFEVSHRPGGISVVTSHLLSITGGFITRATATPNLLQAGALSFYCGFGRSAGDGAAYATGAIFEVAQPIITRAYV